MPTPPIDSLVELIKKRLAIGSDVYSSGDVQNGTTSSLPYVDSAGKLAATSVTASKPVYIDSNSVPQTGGFPFTVQMLGGTLTTSTAIASLQGSATGSADELMHLTFVKGANATATIGGYYRVTITDDAGVITTGNYYVPFYTLA